MIPPLDDGVLPPGVHDATVDEIADVFGRFQRTDRRVTLMDRLRDYLDAARRAGVVVSVLIDGSFVTAKDDPNDIDLIVVYATAMDWDSLQPSEYDTVSSATIRRTYPFDAIVLPAGGRLLADWTGFFSAVNPAKSAYTTRPTKGLMRINL